MISNSRSIIARSFSFMNSNCFCNREALALTFLTFFDASLSSRKRRSRSFLTLRHFAAEKDRSQSRLKRIHSTQLSELSLTRHDLKSREQFWQGRIIRLPGLTDFNCFLRRTEEFEEWILCLDMKKDRFGFRDENLRKGLSVRSWLNKW